MRARKLFNRELLLYVLLQGQAVAWPMPVALPLLEEGQPWPMSLPMDPKTTLPGLVLTGETYNKVVASNGHAGQPQELPTAANGVILSPWRLPYRPARINVKGVDSSFVSLPPSKQTEEKWRQKQQQLESLNRKLEELVAERTEQVRRLASEVMIAERKVQQAVSQLLHDELQQILFSVEMQLTMLHSALPVSEQALLEQTRKIHDGVNLAFEVMRRVIDDLTPPFLHQDLMESLEFLAVLMEERYGLQIELKGAPLCNWPDEEVTDMLFRIVRELLFNVVKHAGVNEATVEVSEEDGRLSVVVVDHGRGFDTAAVTTEARRPCGGLGLASIRKRLELFGGQFHLESQVGQGTRVAVVMLT